MIWEGILVSTVVGLGLIVHSFGQLYGRIARHRLRRREMLDALQTILVMMRDDITQPHIRQRLQRLLEVERRDIADEE